MELSWAENNAAVWDKTVCRAWIWTQCSFPHGCICFFSFCKFLFGSGYWFKTGLRTHSTLFKTAVRKWTAEEHHVIFSVFWLKKLCMCCSDSGFTPQRLKPCVIKLCYTSVACSNMLHQCVSPSHWAHGGQVCGSAETGNEIIKKGKWHQIKFVSQSFMREVNQ